MGALGGRNRRVATNERTGNEPRRDDDRAAEHGLEYVHTLNGTAATDRFVLAILENFQGIVPEVLREFGAPATVR